MSSELVLGEAYLIIKDICFIIGFIISYGLYNMDDSITKYILIAITYYVVVFCFIGKFSYEAKTLRGIAHFAKCSCH